MEPCKKSCHCITIKNPPGRYVLSTCQLGKQEAEMRRGLPPAHRIVVHLAPMLALLATSAAFAPGMRLAGSARGPAVSAVTMVDDDLSLVSAMTDSFYSSKRARLEAELAARLAELEEFEAREQALLQTGGGGGSPMLGTEADLLAQLQAEQAKNAALTAELTQTKLDSELNLQKVAAFWCAASGPSVESAGPAPVRPHHTPAPSLPAPLPLSRCRIAKVDEAKAALPAAASSAAPAPKEKQPDILPHVPVALEASLTLRELRGRLLSYGLSTTGLKAELRSRLEGAMQTDRLKFSSWDPEALAWK
jgi:hypothetical protein